MLARRKPRLANLKDQKARFLIVLEGAVTERDYLSAVKRSLRITGPNLHFELPGPTSPVGIVEKARKLRDIARRTDPYDQVWCVFDVEANVAQRCREGLVEALDKAKNSEILVALSNPCIELWILLHKEEHQAPINSHVCQHRCRELCLMDGKHLKDAQGLFAEYEVARRHSVALERRHIHDGVNDARDRNPSSEVYKLIDAIRSASQK